MNDASLLPLLTAEEPPPFERCTAGGAGVLLTCDHASRRVPRALDALGLAEAELAQHIGWDIGAAAVTRRLATLLHAPALLAGYSRLVIDCNRDPGDPTSIAAVSDGIAVPGNRDLTPAARAARRQAIFDPYHAAITQAIEARLAEGASLALVSIHSFTPVMAGLARPWHVGVLWDEDPRLPVPLLKALRAEPGLVIGDNEPYSAHAPAGYTVRHHAVARGLPHVAIELRQDLVADPAGAAQWAERLARLLRPILAAAGAAASGN